MPTEEDVARFVAEILDKSRLEDYNLSVLAKGDKMVVGIEPKPAERFSTITAQELLDIVSDEIDDKEVE